MHILIETCFVLFRFLVRNFDVMTRVKFELPHLPSPEYLFLIQLQNFPPRPASEFSSPWSTDIL